MVTKEGLRHRPVAPLLIPHAAREDNSVNGFHTPIINVWAIGRDPSAWGPDVEEVIPERFEGSDVNATGRDFQLLLFGAGRRICPRIQLALPVIRVLLAQLVHCFGWELPNGMLAEELGMSEEFDLVVNRAEHLIAILTSGSANDHFSRKQRSGTVVSFY